MKLTEVERRWLEAVLEAAVPPGGDERYPLSALETGGTEAFAEMLAYLPAVTALGMRAAVWLIELGGPALARRGLRRFSRLGPSEREACLGALLKSDVYFIRQLVTLIKMMACFGWGADPRVRAAIGCDSPPKFVKREGTP